MLKVTAIPITVLSMITGRNVWLRLAIRIVENRGDRKKASELRSILIQRQVNGLR